MPENELERRAGKGPEDQHPVGESDATDPSDYADPRVAQPGEDPSGETAMERPNTDET